MPTPWLGRIRRTGQLTVFNKAGAWGSALTAAIATFNGLSFGVRLVATDKESEANIVAKLSDGKETYPYFGQSIAVDFQADDLHGRSRTLVDGKRMEIFFAVAFLPGKVKDPTAGQKEVVTLHELIHCAGLNGLLPSGAQAPNDDHDSSGIMYPQMMRDGNGLIEYLHEKGASAMPPIRVGSQTQCKMRMLWAGAECKVN